MEENTPLFYVSSYNRGNTEITNKEYDKSTNLVAEEKYIIKFATPPVAIKTEATTEYTNTTLTMSNTSPHHIALNTSNLIHDGDHLFINHTLSQKKSRENVILINETTGTTLLKLPTIEKDVKIGKKEQGNSQSGYITIINKNLPFVILRTLTYQTKLELPREQEYWSVIKPGGSVKHYSRPKPLSQKEKALEEASKVFSAILVNIRESYKASVLIHDSNTNSNIQNTFLIIRAAYALQPLKLHINNNSPVQSGDTLTIQKPEDCTEIKITNQYNKVIAELYTKDSYIELS